MELQPIYHNDKGFLLAFAESRIGGRQENQDSFKWQQTELGYLVTVCDGMGGGPGGKTASTIAVEEIIAGIDEGNKDETLPNIIIKAIRRANMTILKAGQDNPELQGMGSTVTVLLINENSAFVAHVGDSRVYQIRGRKKIFRTFDHSMVFEMVKQGVISEEQARLSTQSNIITRALGIKPDIEVDIEELSYEKGDRFVLCTDGIHGTMPEVELVKMLSKRKISLGALTDDIATYVDNIGHTTGGHHDNLTLAIVETKIKSKLRPTMTKFTKSVIGVLCCILLLSIIINIAQYTSYSSMNEANECKTAILNDSIKKTDSIATSYKTIVNQIDSSIKNSDDNTKLIEAIKQLIK